MNCDNQKATNEKGWRKDKDEKNMLRYQYFSTNTEWNLAAFKIDGMVLKDKFAKVRVEYSLILPSMLTLACK